jgi:hypothetical protein
MPEEEDPIQIPIVYVGTEDVPVYFANNFVVQHFNNEFVVTFGQLIPPILLGEREERREKARSLSFAPVKVIGRYGFTEDRLRELIKALNENLEVYLKAKGQRKEGANGASEDT